jgi:hypothetical protein
MGGAAGTDLVTPLPMAVDGVYVPSGFMGDTDSITITPSEEVPDGTCDDDRAPGEPVGDCHIVTYVNDVDSMNWGGVFWQYPDGNWGDFPGLLVEEGATKVTFQAKGGAGGEAIVFQVGMEGTDTFHEEIAVTITTEWTEYEIDVSAATYELRFSWSQDDGKTFEAILGVFDSTKLSDEYNTMELGFTGTFVGMGAHDMTGRRNSADFHFFDCEPSA